MTELSDARQGLSAVLVHIQANPGLELGVDSVEIPFYANSPTTANVRLLFHVDPGDARALRQLRLWMGSMRTVDQVEVRHHAPPSGAEWLHLGVTGQLVTGGTVGVSMSYRGEHVAALHGAAGDSDCVAVTEFARIADAGAVAS